MQTLETLKTTLTDFSPSHFTSTTIGKNITVTFKTKTAVPCEILHSVFPNCTITVDTIEDITDTCVDISKYQYIVKAQV